MRLVANQARATVFFGTAFPTELHTIEFIQHKFNGKT